MTIPAPVSSLALTPTPDSGEVELTWTHSGTDLDHFALVSQVPSSGFGSAWLLLGVKPKADLLVSGTSYAWRTAATQGQVFKVVAFSAVANEAGSSPNPTETFSELIDGTWLLPEKNGQVQTDAVCWMGRDASSSIEEHSHELVAIPSRREEISQSGELHLEKGQLSGVLMERHGQTATEWLERLRSLIRKMRSYDRVLYVNNVFRKKVEVYGPLEKNAITMSGKVAWEVSVNYRELT